MRSQGLLGAGVGVVEAGRTQPGQVELSFSHPWIDSSNVYCRVSLYSDADRTRRLSYREVPGNEEETGFNKVGLPAGTYYVRIDALYWSAEEYTFSVTYRQGMNYEQEPNDTQNTATLINTGLPYMGSLADTSDADWYRFTVPTAGVLTLNFKHALIDSPSVYWKLGLVDINNNMIAGIDVPGNREDLTSYSIGVGPGTYCIKVSSMFFSDMEYALTVNFTPSNNWEREPNNTTAQATQILPGIVYSGVISSPSDVDFFMFATNGGNVSVTFTHDWFNAAGTYWVITIINSNGITEHLRLESPGTAGSLTSPTIALPAGTYYLRIAPFFFSDVEYSFSVNVN